MFTYRCSHGTVRQYGAAAEFAVVHRLKCAMAQPAVWAVALLAHPRSTLLTACKKRFAAMLRKIGYVGKKGFMTVKAFRYVTPLSG